MAGNDPNNQGSIMVDELIGLSDHDQAEVIADHYCKISNQYDPIDEEDFIDYIENLDSSPPMIEPRKVDSIIKTMNKKAATVEGDIPMKLIA